jgi:hypothetical protein
MKKSLIVLALLASVAAQAQETNVDSRAASQAQAGAASQSQAGALGNVLEMNNYAPEVQTVIQDLRSTSDQNVHYSGTVENKSSGSTTSNVAYSGTQTVKNVPSIAMSGPASGPCTGFSGGLSAAGPGWGLGFNGSSVMADCRLRENTRVLGMAMQSLDGTANPQEKAEVTVMFMDAVRGLAQYNAQIVSEEVKAKK